METIVKPVPEYHENLLSMQQERLQAFRAAPSFTKKQTPAELQHEESHATPSKKQSFYQSWLDHTSRIAETFSEIREDNAASNFAELTVLCSREDIVGRRNLIFIGVRVDFSDNVLLAHDGLKAPSFTSLTRNYGVALIEIIWRTTTNFGSRLVEVFWDTTDESGRTRRTSLHESLKSLPDAELPQILLVPKSGTLLKHFVPFLKIDASDFLYPKLDSMITSHPEQTLKEGLSSRELQLAEGKGMYKLSDTIPEVVADRPRNFLQTTTSFRAENRADDQSQLQITNPFLLPSEDHVQQVNRVTNTIGHITEQRSPQFLAEELIQPVYRTSNVNVQQPTEQKAVFLDLDGRAFFDSHFKLSSKFVDQTIDNNVLTRQFPSLNERDDNLGTQTHTFSIEFFHRVVMVRLESEVVRDKLEKVMSSVESFRAVCLWKWSGAGQQGITLEMFAKNGINDMEELFSSIRNFELFQRTVFGECWQHCTLDFIEKIASKDTIAIMEPKYVQSEFERACLQMHDKLRRKADNPEDVQWGKSYANLFSDLLNKVEPTGTRQKIWNHFHNGIGKMSTKHSTESPVLEKRGKDETERTIVPQLCFKFLRKALNVPETGETYAKGCTKIGCIRKHSEVFGMSRENVIQQLRSAPNMNNTELIEAVMSSTKFK
jgi:hypothetical protein